MPYEDLSIDALFPSVHRSIYDFTREAADMFGDLAGIDVVFVGHAFENVIPLVQAIADTGNLRSMIVKNSTGSLHPKVVDRLREGGISVSTASKADFLGPARENPVIAELLTGDQPLLIMDHGGYFAYGDNLEVLMTRPGGLLGVVEYTLNGEERYERLPGLGIPVMSVAQSRVKGAGDIAVAEAIILEAESYLSRGGVGLFDKRIGSGVVGQGRLGAAIAEGLIRRGARRVWVDDFDPVKRASQRLVEVAETRALISHCDVVFLATGNRSVTADDLAYARDDTVIFTVTSPDDELDLGGLLDAGHIQAVPTSPRDTVSYVVTATGCRIHLPFGGEAPNMVSQFGNTDPTIHLPNAAHLAGAVVLARHVEDFPAGVFPIPPELERVVAEVFDAAFPEPSSIH